MAFADDRTGIRAQIQHLKAYATTEPLTQACVDPRYKFVTKGCAKTFESLSGKWAVPGYSGYADLAADRAAKDSYGDHIVQLLDRIIKTDVVTSQPDEIAPDGYRWGVQEPKQRRETAKATRVHRRNINGKSVSIINIGGRCYPAACSVNSIIFL